jgi:hypothetical protein
MVLFDEISFATLAFCASVLGNETAWHNCLLCSLAECKVIERVLLAMIFRED